MSKPKNYNERGPCRKILQMPCFRGASMKALLGCSYGSFPAAAKQSCTIPCGKLLWRSWWNPLRGPCMISFVQVLVRRSCGDPAGISLKSLTQQVALHQDIEDALHWCLYEKSSGMFIESCSCEILYIKGPCLAIFWNSFDVLVWGSGVRSWCVDIALLLVPKQIPAAAVPIMSNLICYCSIATVACIWYIDFL